MRFSQGGPGPGWVLSTPATCEKRGKSGRVYINTLLRISPTASPSMAKESPGCTTMVG